MSEPIGFVVLRQFGDGSWGDYAGCVFTDPSEAEAYVDTVRAEWAPTAVVIVAALTHHAATRAATLATKGS